MPKLKAPLFSLQAKGTLADQVTYQRHPRRNRAISIPTHIDAHSINQLRHRLLFLAGRDEWHWLTPAQRASYETEARPLQITGYNLFLRRFLNQQIQAYTRLLAPGHEGGGTTQHDLSGYSNDGTIFGAVWTKLSNQLPVLYFDGLDDYVNFGASSSLQLDTKLSLLIWTYQHSYVTLNRNNNLFGRNRCRIFFERPPNIERLRFYLRTTTTSYYVIIIDPFPLLQWHLITITYDGTLPNQNLHAYYDNQLIDTVNAPGTLQDPTDDWRIGGYEGPINGYAAQARILNRVLTLSEITKFYNASLPLFT